MEIKNPFLFFIFTIFSIVSPLVKSGDTEALLALKATIDPSDILDWKKETDLCQWQGVKECMKGRVTKLVIENLNLSGTLDQNALNQLDQLRVLSFKGNSISGEIPDLNGLFNLKSLFLNSNNFSGEFPVTVTSLHRIKVLVLAGNKLSGDIPLSLTNLSRLYVLYLEDNQFTGEIPPLNQPSLRFLNVSNNQFSGQITETPVISRFNESSFAGNVNLCGAQLHNNCTSTSPSYPIIPENVSHHHKRSKKLIIIIVPVVVGILILCILAGILIACVRKRRRKTRDGKSKEVEDGGGGGAGGGEEGTSRGGNGDGGRDGNNGGKEGAFSWDQGSGGLGTLVFCGPGDQQMNYSLEDLLKASAETLGRGIIGSTYKAVMESGYIVTVKRLRDSRFPRLEEFRRHVEIIGRLRHPNLVPLRAYFQAKEERLLVYDYFPNGSLFSLVHGTYSVVHLFIYTFGCYLCILLLSVLWNYTGCS